MASILKVDTIQDQAGNNIINESSDTITIGASGDTVNIVGTLQNNGSGVIQGITEADQWRLTADFTGNADPITSNLERNDTTGSGYFGTGMTESSGIFTFPSTGYWLILADFSCQNISSNAAYNFFLKITTDNSTYNKGADAYVNPNNNGSNTIGRSIQFLFDVTNTTTHKIQFGTTSSDPTNSVTTGNTTYNGTSFSFIRLGDT